MCVCVCVCVCLCWKSQRVFHGTVLCLEIVSFSFLRLDVLLGCKRDVTENKVAKVTNINKERGLNRTAIVPYTKSSVLVTSFPLCWQSKVPI